MNHINTWVQGYLVDTPRTRSWSIEQKDKADKEENHFVRPAPTDNKICYCPDPEDAKWIASRLNLASDLEQLTYDFANGKSDGEDLIKYVMDKIK